MFIKAFVKGLRANPFSESLLQDKVKTTVEVRQRATIHMKADEVMKLKRVEERHPLVKSQSCEDAPSRDTTRPTFQRDECCYVPYLASGTSRGEVLLAGRIETLGANFTASKKEILNGPQVTARLRFLSPPTGYSIFTPNRGATFIRQRGTTPIIATLWLRN